MVDLATAAPAVMDYLACDGTQLVKGTGVVDSMLRITSVNTAAGYCEAVLTR